MLKQAHDGSSGAKVQVSPSLPVGAVINCADNTGDESPCILSVNGIQGPLKRRTSCCWCGRLGDGPNQKRANESSERRGIQRWQFDNQSYGRKDGVFHYFEDNAGVIVNNKGEMKGSATRTSCKEMRAFVPQVCIRCLAALHDAPVYL
ncbi:60S ribosomal protein L23-like [Artibeus jamaicensis]|uniref:60S ribosomal protein L23-like n=1 Tax=Artibeus jamaicensis TaxID=9417 RepID=UPI00235A5F20|nr:60S ribosomal protein L23-like [Artibeus jamaicensis]